MPKHIIIVGAGIGGLAAAVRLGALGYRVTVFEKNERVGGKLNLWQVPHPARPYDRPFRFDTGPSLITLPFVFEELFKAAGVDPSTAFKLTKLDPIARFIWQDGMTFDLRANPDDMDREVARVSPADVGGWRRFFERGRKIWDLSAELFLFHAPEQVLSGKAKLSTHGGGGHDWKSRARAALGMMTVPFRIGMFSNFASAIDAEIKHPRLREVLYQYATYSGASSFKAPATLAVIPFAEAEFGGWYLPGGLYGLAQKLQETAEKQGVLIKTSSQVKQVIVEPLISKNGRKKTAVARGIVLESGDQILADAVIVNSDVVWSYRNLIAPAFRKKYADSTLDQLEPGGSGFALCLGVDKSYPQLVHHTKFMPESYQNDLDAMFETHTVPTDPCIYVAASTRTDPLAAPEGCENLFVLASAPALDGKVDWNVAGPQYRDYLVRTLEERWGLTSLAKNIVVQKWMSPLDLQQRYNANAGSIYGLGSNSRRAAFLRPPNRDREIEGLYFAGGATHPGGGLPLVSLSGKIVSELIEEDFEGQSG